MRSFIVGFIVSFGAVVPSRAIVVRVTAPALERTLDRQLFNQTGPNGEPGRHYIKGRPDVQKGCPVYVDEPHITFVDDRVVVTVKTHAKVGFGKNCIGIGVSLESQVSFVPVAEGESVGFRDARIEHITKNKELDALLEPFLEKKLPQEMKVNAAEFLQKLLAHSQSSTGYEVTVDKLELRSMQIQDQELIVDLDANFRVN
jgi:hypothetical protein